MIKNDCLGKAKILRILEKRVDPLEIFARMVNNAHYKNRQIDDVIAKRKERAFMVEEIRVGILTA